MGMILDLRTPVLGVESPEGFTGFGVQGDHAFPRRGKVKDVPDDDGRAFKCRYSMAAVNGV
ncbi:MAG: hypothetical protein JWO80_4542 [Bryobacterales bacterium]|nr:hypothetical protein [Bryobacterales bacterium]